MYETLSYDLVLQIYEKIDRRSLCNATKICKHWQRVWEQYKLLVLVSNSYPMELYSTLLRISIRYRNEDAETKIMYVLDNVKHSISQNLWKKIMSFAIYREFLVLIQRCIDNIDVEHYNDRGFLVDIIQTTVRCKRSANEIFRVIYDILPYTIYHKSTDIDDLDFICITQKSESFMLEAIDIGQIQICEHILKNDKEYIDDSHSFGLIKSCLKGDIPMIKLLHKYGANLHYENEWPIYMAQIGGCIDAIQYLLENGVSIEELSLKHSSASDNVEVLQLVIDLKNNISKHDIQEAFDECLNVHHQNSLEYLYTKFEPQIYPYMVQMLCMENKSNSFTWLFDKKLFVN